MELGRICLAGLTNASGANRYSVDLFRLAKAEIRIETWRLALGTWHQEILGNTYRIHENMRMRMWMNNHQLRTGPRCENTGPATCFTTRRVDCLI